jgi:hypothetical protein
MNSKIVVMKKLQNIVSVPKSSTQRILMFDSYQKKFQLLFLLVGGRKIDAGQNNHRE